MLYRSIANAATLAVLVAFIGILSAKESHANPACGDTLTANTTFDGDLDCSLIAADTAALTIGANNIVVDLNKFTLIGPSACVRIYPAFCVGGDSDGTKGILIDGFDDVTIKNGKLTGFERGIRVVDALGIRIEKLEAFGNAFSAVRVRENSAVIIEGANFHDNFNDAMGVSTGSSLTVLNSKINHNHASGLFVFQADLDFRHNELKDNVRSAVNLWESGGTIMHNKIQDNNLVPAASTDFGQISLVLPGAKDIVVRCNEIKGGFSNDEFGDFVADPLDSAAKAPGGIGIRRNVTTGSGRVEITRNKLEKTPVAIYITGSDAPALTFHVHRNTFKDNDIDIGFETGSGSSATVDAENNFGIVTVDTSDNGGATVDDSPALEKADRCKRQKPKKV